MAPGPSPDERCREGYILHAHPHAPPVLPTSPMQPHDWDRLGTIFMKAIELPPAEREAFLHAACGDDAALRGELEAMLAGHGEGDTAAERLLPSAGRVTATLGVGSRVGAWRLEQLVGRGGMGEVYRAVRVDDQFQQQAAIKVVRPERATPLLVQRFRQERQIMATLEHPGIARLLDGGVSEGGQPYLVMQYVDGVPITRYVLERQLSVRERLQLFVAVCDAVQFAHQHLVVHRDLKPSNILVDGEGKPRLLDFGIAKLLSQSPADSTTGDLLLLTPEHAAPEQFLGDPITTATDVYALGVLLYELLAGRRPFQDVPQVELARAVCERAPRPPSATTPVHADLDQVVLKAMHREPARRYASAGELAQDVVRFLGGWPVVARPDTVGYRLRRFVQRNRALATLAVVTIVTLLGATLFSARQASQRAAALRVAEAQRARANRVTDFLLGVFRATNPSETRGRTVTARELLDQAAARVERDLAGDPAARADFQLAIAQAFAFVGQVRTADSMLTRLADVRRTMQPNEPVETAKVLETLGRVRMQLGRFDEAAPLFREVNSIRAAAFGPDAPELAPATYRLAQALREIEPMDTTGVAQAAFERAIALHRMADSVDYRAIADAQRNFASLKEDQGKLVEALAQYREAVANARRAVDDEDPFLFNQLESYALGLQSNGMADSAIAIHRQLLEKRRKVFGAEHMDVSFSLFNLGRELGRVGRYDEAFPYLEQCIAMRTKLMGPDHFQVAYATGALARARAASGDTAGALAVFTRAKDVAERSLGPTNYATLGYLKGMAVMQYASGKRDAAIGTVQLLADRGFTEFADGDLATLAKDPRFQAIASRAGGKPRGTS